MITTLIAAGVFSATLYDTPPSRQIVLPLARGSMILPPKYADEALDYRLDWSARLDGDTIAKASAATIQGGAVVASKLIFNETSTSFWVSGGRSGNGSLIQCTVVTAGRRTLEQIFTIRCL